MCAPTVTVSWPASEGRLVDRKLGTASSAEAHLLAVVWIRASDSTPKPSGANAAS